MDYSWDSTSLRVLETELPNMSNVMTILGTATGGGNAITDLSFDGNTLISAKNSSFITTKYDETITVQKTFNTTIHSVGIMVQSYDNNSVVCADGVKSIYDINASYDTLLLLKTDKTQLIDAYSKTQADALLDDKLNVSDQIDAYTKGEDDALLLLKADKTQLIDACTKGESDNLLNNKANLGVSYTKGEDDTLLLKADKTTTYTKTETDYLISQIDVGDIDLSGYMTLGTSYTITANKTFNNACTFINSIDGMATNTGASFIKSGADDSVVLLGSGGTNPISEFSNSVDDSNYVKKMVMYKIFKEFYEKQCQINHILNHQMMIIQHWEQ
ncbi:MAG: hypothetical protein EZS28_020061 [Streblomastix strix]|uniref:Uncharacterized protein n=1 Tax=Streblomastix strix TaxID=222440 RepID=A0A5J4VP97_9EUKA|nr:MAG: hypothetical protein EZS28_020061 [Streblomastix strix]